MRTTIIAAALTLLTFNTASGQTTPTQHAYGLDPYNPLDAQILREYGSVLVAQTPLTELRKLDPYNPTHAALLRSLGGAIPLWGGWWHASIPAPASSPLFPTAVAAPTGGTTAGAPDAAPVTEPAGTAAAAAQHVIIGQPESNDGVWIQYDGRRWISGGAAVRLQESAFVRVGEYRAFPVYRARSGSNDVIYLPTRGDLVAPYRLKQ